MSYLDFVIRKECMFLKSIYSIEEINRSEKIKKLEKYYETFTLFLKTSKSFQFPLNNYTSFDEISGEEELSYFCNNYCEDLLDFNDMKEIKKH